MNMTRRRVLKSLLLFGAVMPVGGWFTYMLKKTTPQQYIERVLKYKLDYLNLSEQSLQQFSNDIIKQVEILKLSNNHHRMINVAITFDGWIQTAGWLNYEREKVHDYLARQFLFSTDFFLKGSDVSLVPEYIAFYDPLVRPCRNPFYISS